MVDIGDHGVGHTYRMLLKALIEATDNDQYDVAVVFHGSVELNYALQMLAALIRPLGGFGVVRFTQRLAVFGNHSEIRFYTPALYPRGLRIHSLHVDESWYYAQKTEEEERWLKELRSIENKFGVQRGVDPKASA
jgi:hypothetical protein